MEGGKNRIEPIEGKDNSRPSRTNVWVISTFVLGILLAFVLVSGGITGNVIGTSVSSETASENLVNFAKSQGIDLSVISSSDDGEYYKITALMNGERSELFVTKDGSNLVQLIPLDVTGTQAPAGSDSVVEVSVDDDAVKGDSNAPVTLVEFSDYECPFCGRYYTQTYPSIISEYVEKGLVKIIFRDFPLSFHPNAQKAAEAAEYAGKLGGDEYYYEMHDKLFENQQALSVDNLKSYAKDLGLNEEDFNECLDSGEMAEEVQSDLADGQASGVTGTPGFFINGRPISGAQPFSVFKQIIDEELVKAEYL